MEMETKIAAVAVDVVQDAIDKQNVQMIKDQENREKTLKSSLEKIPL